MITFAQFKKLMDYDCKNKYCLEIFFEVNNSEKFSCCWMGKFPEENAEKDVYWFGLTEDGKNAYDYYSFEEMSQAEVFDGKSLTDIWSDIFIVDINGCDPESQILYYTK